MKVLVRTIVTLMLAAALMPSSHAGGGNFPDYKARKASPKERPPASGPQSSPPIVP